ncbi:Ankyrin repeat domain-containing protein 60 [Phytophthora boehmeriae]|uniref:Ankyrin repeat domain-containing protein 60 n=1 Tax=Phytophthora boehmeriae TaxID=109152 RepID=A0A8T1WU23_9STRA|nr:Ankyrin repeat domain-containing protein 60 [Phytophthora boehmeriae]
MKVPSNYWSDNEETRFIRRVAAPDRPNSKRRQKKRLAVAGAALGLLGASAGIGYATLRTANTTNAVETMQLESTLGDSFHPSFSAVDRDGDGIATKEEILAELQRLESIDVENVKASDLPQGIKENVIGLLEEKLKSDSECAKQASDERTFPVTKADAHMFYYMLDVFCPRVTIAVIPPDEAEEKSVYHQLTEHNAEQVTVEIPTPQGNEEQIAIEGEPVNGEQTIEIPNGEGGYKTTQVKEEETSSGEEQIIVPDGQGGGITVSVPNTHSGMSSSGSEETNKEVVEVVTRDGQTEQVIIEGSVEDGKQHVKIENENGGFTDTEVPAVETSNGEEKLQITDSEGQTTAVVVPAEKTSPTPELTENSQASASSSEYTPTPQSASTPESTPESQTVPEAHATTTSQTSHESQTAAKAQTAHNSQSTPETQSAPAAQTTPEAHSRSDTGDSGSSDAASDWDLLSSLTFLFVGIVTFAL